MRIVLALLCLVSLVGCKRHADQPLPESSLFPAPPPLEQEQAGPSSEGILQRARLLQEVEPNDSPDLAQDLEDHVVVTGNHRGRGDQDGAKAPAPKKRRGRWRTLDTDWFVLPNLGDTDKVSRIELHDASKCADVTVFDAATPKRTLQRATWRRRGRPVISALSRRSGKLLIRVRCRVRNKKIEADLPGPYQLAISTRLRNPSEEAEPNDRASDALVAVETGQHSQGALTNPGDIDLWRLRPSNALPGQAWMLTVTGVPGVKMSIALLRGDGQLLLQRSPARGLGLTLPNLSADILEDNGLLRISARSSSASDTSYAMLFQPLLPVGCAAQSECPQRIPSEREPNDEVSTSQKITAGTGVTGVIDSAGDQDWFEISSGEGSVVSLALTAPDGIKAELTAGSGTTTWGTIGQGAGEPRIQWAGWRIADGRFFVRVAALDGAFDARRSYRLTSRSHEHPYFEQEPDGKPDTPAAQAMAVVSSARWQRQGALLPPGDVDRYGLDLSGREKPLQARFTCRGDRAPGLRCSVLDGEGQATLQLTPPTDTSRSATADVLLPPGRYTVVIDAPSPRMAPDSYQVDLLDSEPLQRALALPEQVSGTSDAAGVKPLPAP